MKFSGWKALACSCILTWAGVTMWSSFTGVATGASVVYAAEEKGVSLPYTAVSVGDVLSYDLTGYETSEVVSTQWYVGNVQVSNQTDYTVTAAAEEKFIKVVVKTSDNVTYEDSIYYSELPVLYIDAEATYDSFVVKTDEYADAVMTLVSDDYGEEQLYADAAGIRLRGNSTSGLAKKPFKVKLDSKADLLGMGEHKHWALLANAIDVTNMRNKLLLDFSGDIGAEFYQKSENVTMIYNGEYMGVYQLVEHMRVGSERVDIYNWEDAAEDVADVYLKALQAEGIMTKAERKEISGDVEDELKADYCWMGEAHTFASPTLQEFGFGTGTYDLDDYLDWEELELPEVTGGALIEMDFYTGASADLLTAYKQPYYFNTPETGSTFTELYDYMKEYIQTVEYALHDTDFTYDSTDELYANVGEGYYDWGRRKRINTTYTRNYNFISKYVGFHYSELLDMDSAVINFLVCEFSRNWDSMKNSAYMYKDIDGKLKMGPAWDFDWAWGNSMYNIDTDYPTGWQTTDEWFANEQYYQTVQWNRMLVRDPYFLQRVYEKYHEIRGTVIEDIIKEGGLLDTYYETYHNASKANDVKWGGTMGTNAGATYEQQYAEMREFILTRVEWLDAQFTSLETLRTSLGYYVTSSRVNVDSIDTDAKAGYTVITASTTESTCTAISFQVNGSYMETVDVTNGVAVLEVPDSVLTKDLEQANVVQVRAVNSSGAYVTKSDGTVSGVYTNAVSQYEVFEKEVCLVFAEDAQYETTVVDEKVVLSALPLETTVEEIQALFANENVYIVDNQGNIMTDTQQVGTGYTIQIRNGDNVTQEMPMIVTGDVDGDGKMNVLDMEAIQKHLLQLTNLDSLQLESGKWMDDSAGLSVIDMEVIQKKLLGLE